MLVIPALDLRGGRCVRLRGGAYEPERDYFADPVRMAKLWRVMNAKVLHLAALGATPVARATDRETIARVANALDIPVQVGGGVRSVDDVEAVLALGAYRVVLGGPSDGRPALAAEALAAAGASRVVAAVDVAEAGLARELEALGVRRVLVTGAGTPDGPDVAGLRALAEPLGRCRVTVAEAVGGYRDLLALQALEPHGVDSVVLGAALYENRFPCQRFWCWHRKDEVDLDRFSTARLALRS